MSFWQQKIKRRIIIIPIILLISGVNISLFLKYQAKKSKVVPEDILLEQKQQHWQGYFKLRDELKRLSRNWISVEKKKDPGDSQGENDYIKTEFERQIQEIQKISSDEEKLKLTELNNTFQEYSKKQTKLADLEFKKKSAAIQQFLEEDLHRKKLAMEERLHDYRRTLESEQRLNLVNLQLQLSLLDLNTSQEGIQDQKDRILLEIARIKREITIKVDSEQKILLDQFADYEKQRRQEVKSELADLKANLEARLLNDLTEYRVKLETDFYQWRERQREAFEKAIQIRRKQKFRRQATGNGQ